MDGIPGTSTNIPVSGKEGGNKPRREKKPELDKQPHEGRKPKGDVEICGTIKSEVEKEPDGERKPDRWLPDKAECSNKSDMNSVKSPVKPSISYDAVNSVLPKLVNAQSDAFNSQPDVSKAKSEKSLTDDGSKGYFPETKNAIFDETYVNKTKVYETQHIQNQSDSIVYCTQKFVHQTDVDIKIDVIDKILSVETDTFEQQQVQNKYKLDTESKPDDSVDTDDTIVHGSTVPVTATAGTASTEAAVPLTAYAIPASNDTDIIPASNDSGTVPASSVAAPSTSAASSQPSTTPASSPPSSTAAPTPSTTAAKAFKKGSEHGSRSGPDTDYYDILVRST